MIISNPSVLIPEATTVDISEARWAVVGRQGLGGESHGGHHVARGQGHPRRTEELATSRLEDIQIACVIHMVAHRAIGVSHPVKVAEL